MKTIRLLPQRTGEVCRVGGRGLGGGDGEGWGGGRMSSTFEGLRNL